MDKRFAFFSKTLFALACTLTLSCGSSSTCPSPEVLCGSLCYDLRSDVSNCGRCGTKCAAGQVCTAGACKCPDGSTGDCTPAGCPTGQASCSGTCRDLSGDPANCGKCGTACPGGQVCASGQCMLSCPSGETDCGGSCRDLTTDTAHCGTCSTACDAGQLCSAGKCALSCQPGLTECSGTCRDLMTDPAHCGACGTACGPGRLCSGGACANSCMPNLTDCGGTCRDLTSDDANCGACNNACATFTHCAGGQCCRLTANATCNGVCTDTRSDAANCGACGTVCLGGQVCWNGCRAPVTAYTATSGYQDSFIDACDLPGHVRTLVATDDGDASLEIPFPVMLFDKVASQIAVSSNGMANLSEGITGYPTSCAPDAAVPYAIMPFWADLVLRPGVCAGTVGPIGNRLFVVTWQDAQFCCGSHPNDHLTFDLVFPEASPAAVDFVYRLMAGSTQGTEAGIGVQNGNASVFTSFSCKTPSLPSPSPSPAGPAASPTPSPSPVFVHFAPT
jgi:hypothetical protein